MRASARLVPELLLALSAFTFSLPGYYKPIAAAIAGCVILAASLRSVRHHPISIALVAPILTGSVLSICYGAAPGPTVESMGVLLGALGFLRLGATGGENEEGGAVLAVGAGLLALAGIVEWIAFRRTPILWFFSPVDLGVAVLLLGLAASRSVRCGTVRDLFLALICLAAALSTSRVLMVAALVAALPLLSKTWLRIAIPSAMALASPFLLARLEGDPLAWGRSRIYACAANLILDRPWTGWGLGAFDAVSRRALLPDPLPIRHMRIPVFAHCDALELAFEIGIPLATAVVLGTIIAIVALRKTAPAAHSALLACTVVSLFQFPLHQSFPLFLASYCAGAVDRATGRKMNPLIACAGVLASVALLVYSFGLLTHDPSLARYDARLALERLPDPEGVFALAELEPERPESHWNLAAFALKSGNLPGGVRHLHSAVERAPKDVALRLALARVSLELAGSASDSTTAASAMRVARSHILYAGAVEPLFLAAYAVKSDTVGFDLANLALDRASRSTERPAHIMQMRERL